MTQSFLLSGESGLQSTQDGQGPTSQGSAIGMRNVEQIADHFDGDGRCKVFNQITVLACFELIEQAVHQLNQTRLHGVNGTTRQGAHDELAHTCVARRIVEDQAVGVVLEKRCILARLGKGGLVERLVVVLGRKLYALV